MNTTTVPGHRTWLPAGKLFFIVFLLILTSCTPAPVARNTEATTEYTKNVKDAGVSEIPQAESSVKATPRKVPGTEVVIQSKREAKTEAAHDPLTGGLIHIVRSGDTVAKIAGQYLVRAEDVLAWNTIENPDYLPVGSKLVIKDPGSGPDPGGETEASAESEQNLDNTAYGWTYPAGSDVETMINQYRAYSRIPAPKNELMLTFDSGSSYKDYARQILDILKEKNVAITFFVTGTFLEQEPQTVQRMVQEGHTVGNHTLMHLNGPQVLAGESPEILTEDILEMEQNFRTLTGTDISPYLRPPDGYWSVRSLARYRDLGYTTLFWDLAYRDWEIEDQLPEEEALQLLKDQTRDGAIIMLHSISETNTKILGAYIDWAEKEGYTFVLPRDIFPE